MKKAVAMMPSRSELREMRNGIAIKPGRTEAIRQFIALPVLYNRPGGIAAPHE
jgi:hypothetical protein